MLIHCLLISSGIIKGSIVVLMGYGDFRVKVFSCFFLLFFLLVWKRKVTGDASVLRSDSGNNHFPPTWCPVTVGDVFLADVLDRAAHTGSITQQSW